MNWKSPSSTLPESFSPFDMSQPHFLPSLALFGMCLGAKLYGYDSRVTYHTPEEIQGFGDFNGDTHLDVVTVDRATGQFRIGLAQPDGSLIWQATRSSGCPGASDLAIGPVRNAGALDLALTGPTANQIFLIDPNAAFSRPELVTPNGLGPSVIATADLNQVGNDPTLHDLIVFTGLNSPPNNDSRNLFLSLPGSITSTGDVNTGDPIHHTSRVLLKAGDTEIFGSSTPLHDGFEDNLGYTPLGDQALNGCESPKYQSLGSFQGVCRYSSELRGSRSANQP